MNLFVLHEVVFRPAYTLLPNMMNSQEATTQLMTIGLQESGFKHRVQLVGRNRHWWESYKGPARGGWQFELYGGVKGVMTHPSSRDHALYVIDALRYPDNIWWIYTGMAHNDVLAYCMARLLLWTDPEPLPDLLDPPEVWWQYYLRNWRPGKPHRGTWDDHWYRALQVTNKLKAQGMWS